MASTYTTNTGIELIATGEQSGTWGDTTNVNLQIIDRLTNGVGAISLSGTSHTLTTANGTLSDGQYAVLVFEGSPSGTNTVTISPNDQQKLFFVKNNSGESVVLTQGTGGDVTIPDTKGAVVYADGAGAGAAVVDLSAAFSVTGALLASNNLSDLDDAAVALTNLGLTATAAEINILEGATLSTDELNILDGLAATTDELNILDGVTATTDELNILDGVTATTAELNYVDVSAPGTSEASKALVTDSLGNLRFQEELQVTTYLDTVVALSGVAVTIDCDEANTFTLTTSGNTTFTFNYSGVNLTTDDAYAFTLRVTAGGTHTLSWPASVRWPGGTAPDAPADGETDVFVFFTTDGGTTWYGFQAGDAHA